MKTISRYIMTLALLITAVGGAWAQTQTLLTTITATAKEQASYSTANVATVSFSTTANGSSAYLANWGWWGYGWIATVTAAEGYTITKCIFYDDANRTATDSEAPFVVETTEEDKTPRINGTPIDGGNMWSKGIMKIEVYGYVTPTPSTEPDVEVTTNAAEEGATFTEASFEMPTSDVDVDYELVRDMGYKVAFSGVPTRARLAKDGDGKFHFADPLTFQLLDNIDAANPKDITSAEGITFMVGEVDAVDIEGSTFYQLDKETLVPLADFLADAHLGNYAICAVASTGEYDGTVYSSEFTAVEEYDLTVKPANDFSKGKIESVTVGSESVTIDANTGEATKTGIAPDTEVKIKAKRGYVIDKVEVKKGAAGKTITIGDMELTYADGDTWETIVSKNSDKIKTLAGGYIVQVAQPEPNKYRYIKVVLSNKVNPSDIIDPSKNYEWGTIEVYS